MSYYASHVFFCCNKRDGACCSDKGAPAMRNYAKQRIGELALSVCFEPTRCAVADLKIASRRVCCSFRTGIPPRFNLHAQKSVQASASLWVDL